MQTVLQNTLSVPYFGFLREALTTINHKTGPEKSSQNQRPRFKDEIDQPQTIETSIVFSDGENPTNTIETNILKVSLLSQSTVFGLLSAQKMRFRLRNSSNYTNIFFSRPFHCKGPAITNFKHSHEDNYEIFLQPFKPLFRNFITQSSNPKRHNKTSNKTFQKEGLDHQSTSSEPHPNESVKNLSPKLQIKHLNSDSQSSFSRS